MIYVNYNTYFYILISIVIYYIIFEEIIKLTIFVFKYDKDYDYGKRLLDISNNEYFEYETNRYQINNNIIDKSFTNDNYNNKNYLLMILIISIIVSLYVSLMFSQIVYSTFIDYNVFKNIFMNDDSTYFINSYNILLKLFLILIIILYICISCLIPLYIIYKMIYNKDISVFNKENSESYYNKFWYVIFSLLILLRFIYFIKDNYDNEDDKQSWFYKYIIYPFVRYKNAMIISFDNDFSDFSIFSYFLYFFIFLIVLYYLTNILIIYKDYVKYNENITDKNDKRYKERFYDNYKNNEIYDNILYKFFINILGISKQENSINNNQDFDKIFITYLPRYVFILLIFLISLMVAYYIIYYFSNKNTILSKLNILNPNDTDVLYYCIICPMICIFVLILITNMTTEYNTYINKYILYEPSFYYKSDITNINNSFNKILNDMYIPITNETICKNATNTILLTLYSYTLKNINNLNHNISIKEDDNILIDINPEFTYNKECISVDINYNDIREYNIDYYLKNKLLNKNILYDFYDCDKINNEVFINLIYNLLPPTIKKKDILEIKKDYKIDLNNKKYIIEFKNNIKNNIKKALFNTLISNKNFDGSDIINTNIINNPNNIYSNVMEELIEEELIIYKDLIELITDEYIKLVIKNLKLFVIYIYNEYNEYYNSFNIDILFTSLNILSDNNKRIYEYAENIYLEINNTFDDINNILSNKYKTDNTYYSSIINYIIENYNNINSDNKYNNKDLIKISENNEYKKYYNNSINYKIFKYILKYITNIKNDLDILNETRKNNQYLNIKYYSDINKLIDEVDYISKYNLKNIENKNGNYVTDINNIGLVMIDNKEYTFTNITIILISELKDTILLLKNEIFKTSTTGNIINNDITQFTTNTKILLNKLLNINNYIKSIEKVYNSYLLKINIEINEDNIEYYTLNKKNADIIKNRSNNVGNMVLLLIIIYIILILLIQIIK